MECNKVCTCKHMFVLSFGIGHSHSPEPVGVRLKGQNHQWQDFKKTRWSLTRIKTSAPEYKNTSK